MEGRHLVTLCTCPSEAVAEQLAAAAVEAGAAACVNIVPGITSVYRWQDRVEKDQEWLLVIKTTTDAYAILEETISRLHPYELPEVIAVPIAKGLPGYLTWIDNETQRER